MGKIFKGLMDSLILKKEIDFYVLLMEGRTCLVVSALPTPLQMVQVKHEVSRKERKKKKPLA